MKKLVLPLLIALALLQASCASSTASPTPVTLYCIAVDRNAIEEPREVPEDLFVHEGRAVMGAVQDHTPGHVTTLALLGREATLHNVRAGFARAAELSRADSLTIVYLDTHGGVGSQGFGCVLADGMLWEKEIHHAINSIKGRVLFLLDSCHAGAVLDRWEGLHALVIASSRREETAATNFLADRLRYAVLDADYNHNGVVDAEELVYYLVQHDGRTQHIVVGSYHLQANLFCTRSQPVVVDRPCRCCR